MRTTNLNLSALLLCVATISTTGCLSGTPTDESAVDQESTALRCADPNGCTSPKPPKDTCGQLTGSLTLGATTVEQGQTTTLSWFVSVPKDCIQPPILLNGARVAASGSMSVTPLSNFGYLLQAGTDIVATTMIRVNLPDVVYIDGSTFEWVSLLVQATGPKEPRDQQAALHPRRVVLGENVDMDVSRVSHIVIEEGVTITSELTPPRDPFEKPLPPGKDGKIPQRPRASYGPQPPVRNASHLGPRIFTTLRQIPLFTTNCDPGFEEIDRGIPNNIHISGFRIEGPDFDSMEGDDKLGRAIEIDSCRGVEVENMEISGFSGSAIFVGDSKGRLEEPPSGGIAPFSAVRIHDNFIHHNQHVGGNGYGVDFGAGAYGTVERNVFDFNRHAVTSSGHVGTGYIADHNLILKGGGRHDKWYSTYTHIMDVHGDRDCRTHAAHSLLCGHAGHEFFMTNNAFQYTNESAIKIRGTPTLAVNISGNVFAKEDEGGVFPWKNGGIQWGNGSIETTEGPRNINVGANTYGVDTFGEYGVCDFDGDGTDDLFLATGASWWFMSGAKMHWVYLGPNTERLSQVRLGDFTGDKRCDVIAKNSSTNLLEISSGGTGAWTTLLGNLNDPIEELRTGDFNGDGVTDIFRRVPDGQWWVISPGRHDWVALGSSSVALEDLKLGDFNGDGITDVLGWNKGKWAISWSGRSAWQPAAKLSDDIKNVLIANIDGVPGDDVIRVIATSNGAVRWEVSSGARSNWNAIAHTPFSNPMAVRMFVGKFDDTKGAEILALDPHDRVAGIYGQGHPATFERYNRYQY